MIHREVTITNRLGLHARAAARFVAIAAQYEADIHVCRGDKRVNGKSIMGLMMLAAGRGSTIELEADGTDADEAMERLVQLVEGGFQENGTGSSDQGVC